MQRSVCSLAGSGQMEALSYRFKRNKAYAANIEDIYNGLQYRKLADHSGPLSKLETISFILNTDGVGPLFHSTQFSIWPLYLMINEFPYQLRFEMCTFFIFCIIMTH